MKLLRIFRNRTIQVAIIFVATLTIYTLTSPKHTPYNHFVLLAQSILEGHLDITPYWQPHLERAIVNNKLYLPYPPMPAILLVPYVLFAGLKANQVYASIFIGSINTVLAYVLIDTLQTTHNRAKTVVLTLFFAFSSTNWFLSAFGSTWYFSHIVAMFFILAALVLTLKQKSPLLAGICAGSAFFTRSPTLFALPFFVMMLFSKKSQKPIILFLFGYGLLALCNILYNTLAFQTVFFNAGYMHLPGLLSEPWFDKGLFHPSYLPRNLEVLFTMLPREIQIFPYLAPAKAGLALWITAPLVFFIFRAPITKKITRASWIAIILIAIPILTHGHTGMVQFGYRRMTDFLPFLLILLSLSIRKVRWFHIVLLLWGIGINLWGVLMFKYGLAVG